MKKISLIILLLVVAAYIGIILFPLENKQAVVSDATKVTDSELEVMVKAGQEIGSKESGSKAPQFSAELADVTGGEASGQAFANYENGQYQLYVEFQNLPELKGTDFYEGWVVRKSPLSVISTGALIMDDKGEYLNTFISGKDLSDHTNYVLTLEPDDGDPAPADHILEGEF